MRITESLCCIAEMGQTFINQLYFNKKKFEHRVINKMLETVIAKCHQTEMRARTRTAGTEAHLLSGCM